jgi:hypothetical protein
VPPTFRSGHVAGRGPQWARVGVFGMRGITRGTKPRYLWGISRAVGAAAWTKTLVESGCDGVGPTRNEKVVGSMEVSLGPSTPPSIARSRLYADATMGVIGVKLSVGGRGRETGRAGHQHRRCARSANFVRNVLSTSNEGCVVTCRTELRVKRPGFDAASF